MVTDGREKEREIKKGKYHGKKKEVPEMRTQECQIILFHLGGYMKNGSEGHRVEVLLYPKFIC